MPALNTVLKTTYAKEMKLIAQVLKPRIIAHTDVVANVGGVSYRPQTLDRNVGAETAGASALGVAQANLAVNHRSPTINLTPRFSPTYLHEHEMKTFSASGSVRRSYATNQLANINRWQDQQVVTALGALNTPLAVAGSADALGQGNFSYNKFISGLEILDANEYENYSNVVCLITAQQIKVLRTFAEIKSNDFDTIHQLSMGKVVELWGATFIKVNDLPLTVGVVDPTLTTRKCYMFTKTAVISAFAGSQMPESSMEWVQHMEQFYIGAKTNMGAGVLFQGGVVELESEELPI